MANDMERGGQQNTGNNDQDIMRGAENTDSAE